ncbi:GMP/IMP nucleotidase [Pleionea sediminis]|uniref:GMP/IMP nucleotidase n=1 Tax=Pleionea sediminis TaxID=2569479 RepID=UPI001186CFDD|nr:GMP/IMP nucleotidase [Pleionea sediminis]
MPVSLDWSAIDTVLLDMDGTILDLHYDNFFWLQYLPGAFAAKNNIDEQESREILKAKFDSQKGKLNWYCLDYWTRELDLDIVSLKKEIEHKVAFRPKAVDFLKYLNQIQKRVILATNAHQQVLEIKLLNTQFHQYFEELVSSHEFGLPKEEQGFWMCLEERLGFDKNRTLFIDDSIDVLNSAQEYGIRFLLGIEQPDSQQKPRSMKPYGTLSCFSEIMAIE